MIKDTEFKIVIFVQVTLILNSNWKIYFKIYIFRPRLGRSCRHKLLWGPGYESVAACVLLIFMVSKYVCRCYKQILLIFMEVIAHSCSFIFDPNKYAANHPLKFSKN